MGKLSDVKQHYYLSNYRRRAGILTVWLLASLALAAAAVGEEPTYTSQRYQFTLASPPGYDVQASSPHDIHLSREGKAVLSMRVDDQLVWFIHHLINPDQSMIISRPGDDAWAKLVQKAREDETYFRRYARQQVVNWCAADGPDSSLHCQDVDREERFTSQHGLVCLEFHLTMIREDSAGKIVQKKPVGPVYAVYVTTRERPLVLVVAPPPGTRAPADTIKAAKELINSIQPLP